MILLSPVRYQQEATDNALSIFRYALNQIELAPDEVNRRRASSYNGAILLEAPTGSGKTLMAGNIAEQFSMEAKIVWFWLTPFAGLVDQASISLRKQFAGLRVRDIQGDRIVSGSRSGDVFVTTWAAVVANKKESRKLRRDGDLSLSIDSLVRDLRESGFHIGVVVDEAHHTFNADTEAVRFYTEVMQPEFTLLITATPDDKDAEKFKSVTGIVELHRITVSRKDAVDAGLIKEGIKSIAYLAPDEQKALVDFQRAALADAKVAHERIKEELKNIGVSLTPLMLVQVASSKQNDDVQRAREHLIALGFREESIASYTSDEPTNDLMAVALDETKEVLIFKMAVALGFDAPRAFTLVSMRSAKDNDFGIQVVGRILRVHRLLQSRELPELLRHGYVFLADAENQSGLVGAADKINSLQTGLSAISPYTMVINVAGKTEVQVVQNGQSSFIPIEPQEAASAAGIEAQHYVMPTGQTLLDGFILQPTPAPTTQSTMAAKSSPKSGNLCFALKYPGLKFKTERLPLNTSDLLTCIGQTINIGDKEFAAGLRAVTTVIRREEEIFSRSIQATEYQASLSDNEIARRAQRVLFEPDYLDPRDLHAALIERIRTEFKNRGARTVRLNHY